MAKSGFEPGPDLLEPESAQHLWDGEASAPLFPHCFRRSSDPGSAPVAFQAGAGQRGMGSHRQEVLAVCLPPSSSVRELGLWSGTMTPSH